MSAFLKRDDSFLMAVDIQERLHAAMEESFKDTYVRNALILVETARACGVPVIVSEQYPRGLGPTIGDVSARLGDNARHEKLFFSCYRDEGLRKAMEATRRNTAVITGIEAHVCVMQTAIDLKDAGFEVVVASDAVCSRRAHDRTASLHAMAALDIRVYPTETIAFMLMEKAATDIFKRLSPLFK